MTETKIQTEFLRMKTIMFNMKNTLNGIHIRFDRTRGKISELQDIIIETEKNPRRRRKMNFSELLDKFK